jgi:hypothetical protein
MIYRGEYPVEELRYHLGQIIDTLSRGDQRCPKDAPLSTESASWMIEARLVAAKQLINIPDNLWQWARVVFHVTMAQYQQQFAEFAADPDLGHLFERPGLELYTGHACVHLLTLLGVGLRLTQEDWDGAGLPQELLPRLWLASDVKVDLRSKPSALVLPNGLHPVYLEAAVQLREANQVRPST